MAQSALPRCPRCGTPAEAGQRFCSECGAAINLDGYRPTERASGVSFMQANASGTQQPAVNTQPAVQSNAQPDGQAPARSPMVPTVPVVSPEPDATVIAPQTADSQSPPQESQSPFASPTPAPGSAPGQTPYAFGSTYSTVPTSGEQFYRQTTEANVIPPPPPPESFVSAPQSSPALPAAPVVAPGNYEVPSYARAPRRSRGCLIVSIVLLLVLALGGVGLYFGFLRNHSGPTNQGGNMPAGQQSTVAAGNTPAVGNTPATGSSPASGGTSTANAPAPVQLNLSFTYATISYTITSVRYEQGFSDDSSISAGGVRVSLSESNATSRDVVFSYGDVSRLILPDGSAVAPSNELHFTPPASQTSNTSNWFDFSVATPPADLTALALQMGTASENQMRIPLKPGADLSKYQPATTNLNVPFTYAGMQWTLTKVVITYSADGQQATASNLYVTLTLNAVNNSSQEFIDGADSYMRLKSGSVTNPPVSNGTFPISIASQATGNGYVIFLMPQGNTSFTLMMLAQQGSPPIQAVSTSFQA